MNAADRASSVATLSIFFCFLAALCEGFDIQAAGVAALGLSQTFTPTPRQLGLFFSAGNAGLLVGAVVGGRLADRFGRKIVLVCSIGVFGVCSLATSRGWSMDSLIWMRAMTGVGLGGSMPNLIALASEVSAARSRNAKVAITYIGMPLGGAVASLVVLLLTVYQWRWIFVVGGIAPLLIATSMAKWMPAAPWLLGAGRNSQQVLVGVLPIAIVCGLCIAALGWRAFRDMPRAATVGPCEERSAR